MKERSLRGGQRRAHLNLGGVTWSPNEDITYVSMAPENFVSTLQTLQFDAYNLFFIDVLAGAQDTGCQATYNCTLKQELS